MMHEGKIVLDIKGERRNNLSVSQLIELFYETGGEKILNDRLLLI